MKKIRVNTLGVKCPSNLVANWADLMGLEISPMLRYCSTLRSEDTLPRGLKVKLESLRPKVANKLKNTG